MKKEEKEEISKEEVWSVLEYMDGLYRNIQGSEFYWYNTENEKNNLKNLTDDPRFANLEDIRKTQANWKYNDTLLKEISTFMQFWDALYSKALKYYCGLLDWNWSYYCENATEEDYASEEYKEDLKRVYDFFNKFDLKSEGSKIIKNCLLTDTYYTWFRKSPLGYTLQMMPQDMCKITGSSSVSEFLYDFNLTYFNNPTVNIENFDKSLVNAFSQAKENGNIKSFAIRKGELNRSSVNNNWLRTKVSSGAWCWKFNNETFNVVPPFTTLFKNFFDDDTIQRLQKNKDVIGSNFILWGEMPLKKEGMAGTEKNAFKVEPKQIGQLLSLARRGLEKELKIIALPLENSRSAQFQDGNSLMSKNFLGSTATQMVAVPEMIYTTDKMSQEIARNALMSDYKWVSKIYSQMEKFLNYFVNRETEVYKFKFKVDGSSLYWDRQNRQESLMKLSDKGILVNISKFASAWDMQPQELYNMMLENKYGGDLINNLQLLLNTNTSKDGSVSSNGRPKVDDNNLTESTSVSREYS